MIGAQTATDTLRVEGNYLKYGSGKSDKIVFVNGRLLRDGWPTDVVAYPVEGNCLAPQVQSGDILVVVLGQLPRDGDIVALRAGERRLVNRYREDRENTWLESAHGKRALDSCTIVGVVLLIGRSPFALVAERVGLLPVPIRTKPR